MPCTVFVYDSPRSALLSPTVDLLASDVAAILATARSRQMGPNEVGNNLVFAAGPFVYTVTVHDPSGTYSPLVVPAQNGRLKGRHDLVLKPLPPAGAGALDPGDPLSARPRGFADISPHIEARPDWDDDQKEGVRRLVAALVELPPSVERDFEDMISAWASWLDQLGIPSAVIRRKRPSSASMAAPSVSY